MEMNLTTKWVCACSHDGVCKHLVYNRAICVEYWECGFGDARCTSSKRKILVTDIVEINEKAPVVMVADFSFDKYTKSCVKHSLNNVFLVAANEGGCNSTALCYECLKEEMQVIGKELSDFYLQPEELASLDYFDQ